MFFVESRNKISVFSLSGQRRNDRRLRRTSENARHRRNNLSQRKISKIVEKTFLRFTIVRNLFRSERKKQSEEENFQFSFQNRIFFFRKIWFVWLNSKTSNCSSESAGRKNSNRPANFASL